MASSSPARLQMLTSAALLFRERGIAGTSVADVVEHAQAPRGSVYHYFPQGKAQLAAEATELAGRFVTKMISGVFASVDTPEEAVEAFLAYWRHGLVESDFQAGCPVAAAALGTTDLHDAVTAAGAAFAIWERALATGLQNLGVDAERAASLATTSVAAIEGAIIVSRAQKSTDALDRVGAEMKRLARELTTID